MGSSYAVSWRESEGASDSGRLELGPHSLRLEGANSVEIVYVDVTGVSVGRGSGDRLGGRTTVVVHRRDEHPIWIAPVAQHAALLELHDRLSALAGIGSAQQ
jgi:hypothetical protein